MADAHRGTTKGATTASCTSIDAHGRIAAHTGAACIDWCGHVSGDGYSVAGNMLAGPRVLRRHRRGLRGERATCRSRERLLAALDAGDAAGGDKRGRQAAALLVCTGEDYPFLDLRVDDHDEPLAELQPALREEPRALPAVRGLPARVARDPRESPTAR